MRCVKCNSEVRDGVNFCPVCGTDQRKVESPPPPPPPPALLPQATQAPALRPPTIPVLEYTTNKGRSNTLKWLITLGALVVVVVIGMLKFQNHGPASAQAQPTGAPVKVKSPIGAEQNDNVASPPTLNPSLSTPPPQALGDSVVSETDKNIENVGEVNPKLAGKYNQNGINLCRIGKSGEAVNEFKKAAKANPNNPEYWNNIGYAYQLQNKFATSNYFCQKALDISPNRSVAFGSIAYNYVKLGRLDDAVESWIKHLNNIDNDKKRGRAIQFLRKLEAEDQDPRVGDCIRRTFKRMSIPISGSWLNKAADQGNPQAANIRSTIMSVDELSRLVVGKSQQEVFNRLGKPQTIAHGAFGEVWVYRDLTQHPVTGQINVFTQIEFDGSRIAIEVR